MRLKLYSDGGARGNPGPAAGAYLIFSEEGKILKKGACCLGKRTNNQAEYEALIAGLEAASAIGGLELTCHLDSEVVAKHLTGEYQVKNAELRRLWSRVQELKRCFRIVRFVNVPRSNSCIQQADAMVNETLDEERR